MEEMEMTTMYNGWKNRQTWNVALWLGNDERLYSRAVDYVKHSIFYRTNSLYAAFIHHCGLDDEKTPDGIKYLGSRLDYKALNEYMRELAFNREVK